MGNEKLWKQKDNYILYKGGADLSNSLKEMGVVYDRGTYMPYGRSYQFISTTKDGKPFMDFESNSRAARKL